MSKIEIGVYPIKGQQLFGVTSVLELGLGTSFHLVDWATSKGALKLWRAFKDAKKENKRLTQDECTSIALSARDDILKAAQLKGRVLHSAIEHHLEKGTHHTIEDEKHAQYYARFLEWLQENSLEPIKMEQLVYDLEEGYAGRFDFYGMLKGKKVLIDFKTSNHIKAEWGLQLVAYKNAWEKMGHEVEEMYVLYIQNNRIHLIQFQEKFETFKKVKDLFDWKLSKTHDVNFYMRGDAAKLAEEV